MLRVSLIIPLYQDERFIAEAVASAVANCSGVRR
jgi:glycosyltransferase involved in cell wall biosynthesis